MSKILVLLLLFSFQALGQAENEMTFYPIEPIDTISDLVKIKRLVRVDSLKNEHYFFIDQYRGQQGLYFVQKKGSKWIVFDFELPLNFGPNSSVSTIQALNPRYFGIQVYRSASGGCPAQYGQYILLDAATVKYINFFHYNRVECYHSNAEVASVSECKAKVKLTTNILQISSNRKSRDGLECIESASYRIDKDKLVKIK